MNDGLRARLLALSTPHIADAGMRLGVEVRCGPAPMQPVDRAMRCIGPVRPARHVGSVEVFSRALESATPGQRVGRR